MLLSLISTVIAENIHQQILSLWPQITFTGGQCPQDTRQANQPQPRQTSNLPKPFKWRIGQKPRDNPEDKHIKTSTRTRQSASDQNSKFTRIQHPHIVTAKYGHGVVKGARFSSDVLSSQSSLFVYDISSNTTC